MKAVKMWNGACSDARSNAERMISRGCFLHTSMIRAFSILLVSSSCWNTGMSRMPRRIHRPMQVGTNAIAKVASPMHSSVAIRVALRRMRSPGPAWTEAAGGSGFHRRAPNEMRAQGLDYPAGAGIMTLLGGATPRLHSTYREKVRTVNLIEVDVAIVGGGGAGLRAAIAAAEVDSGLKIALISKVYPMRSHTVAAEGGSAGVLQASDSLEDHFHDTVAGGDWLCDQDVVDYFVAHCTEEMMQLEHWGCPWSRKPDGHVNVRAFGGMKIERTWFAADKSGFHILHTLFQTSIKYPAIRRLDEYFCVDLIVEEGRCQGVVAIEIATGEFALVAAKAVIIATGGAGRVFLQNTNGGIVTGDGMALAFRHGVPLRDMEFMQYHPTCMPGTGLLFTEACRGEGGILTNRDGYRYLQDYGLGPPDPWPRNKAMELGPRDRISQAFWHEERKGRTTTTPHGAAVYLDLRQLGARKLRERLPQICELAEHFLGIDPAKRPIPVRPAVHYTMGGILVNIETPSPLPGLFAAR